LIFFKIYPTIFIGLTEKSKREEKGLRISTKGRYSMQAMLYLALLPPKVYVSTRDIAEKTGISEGYLEQLFIPLRKEGLIKGIRGPSGGYILGKPASEISAGIILRSVEGSLKPTECVDARKCASEKSCTSRQTWKNLYDGIKDFIDSVKLSELVEDYKSNKEPEYSI
jgi:Rrf2 family protein